MSSPTTDCKLAKRSGAKGDTRGPKQLNHTGPDLIDEDVMPKISSLLEVSPWLVPHGLAACGPPTHERTFSEGWFRWYYLASVGIPDGIGCRRVLIGPFRSKRKATRAWDHVRRVHLDWVEQQRKLMEAMGLEEEYEAHRKKTGQGSANHIEVHFAEESFPKAGRADPPHVDRQINDRRPRQVSAGVEGSGTPRAYPDPLDPTQR